MRSVTKKMNVWLKKPAMKSSNKELIELNKNCKTTISCKKPKKCENTDSNSHISRNSDRNCQVKEKYQYAVSDQ